MKLSRPRALLCAAGALLTLGALGTAQIERLTLAQMIAKTENTVFGTIVDSEVFKVDHEKDGPDLYFTTLFIQGHSLIDGKQVNVDVTFPGGMTEDGEGVYNSEAPSADDIKTGNKVVVSYKWVENMGGDVAGNLLWASHGSLFRTAETPGGTIVLGRGDGYAVSNNVSLSALDEDVTRINRVIQERREGR